MEHQQREAMMHDLEREMTQRGYSRRDFVKVASALGLSGVAGLLAACGDVKPQTDQGRAASGTPTQQTQSLYSISDANGLQWPKTAFPEPTSKIQLSIAHAWEASFWTRQQQFDTLFMKRHPNISIQAENNPWVDFLQKYLTQAAGGSLPDILYCHFSWAQQFIKQNMLTPVDDYIAKQPDFNLSDFTKPSMGFYQRAGKQYGVAYDCGPLMLFYNKDLFDKAGVKYPTDSWTLDDLKQNIVKLTSGSGRNKIFGFTTTPTPAQSDLAPSYLFPFGAKYVNEPQETQSFINQPQAVTAMQWWMELYLKYKAVPSPADTQAMTQQGGAFVLGRSAMDINGSWATPGLNQNAHFKWDVALWPKGPQGRFTAGEGSAYVITQSSQQKDAAWIYLNEYLSTAGQSFMWGMTGRGSPGRKSAWNSYLSSKYAPGGAKLILDALNTYATNEVMHQPSAPKVVNTATPIWDRVIAGSLSVKDGLNQVQQQIVPILAQNT
jgi:multiple sugar transport system substrate-binding protein